MRRTILLLALLLALGAPTVRAESPSSDGAAPRSLVARLGTPARDEVVTALLGGPEPLDAGAAVRLAHALGYAGGPAAVTGTTSLLDHLSDEVRLAALGAAARLDLRHEALRTRLLRLVAEGTKRERCVAVEALGHVGDGRDMDLLLRLTKGEDRRVATASYGAMERLTGARIPYVHARWAWLWSSFRRRAALLLAQAREAMAASELAPDLSSLASLVKLYGWTDLPATRTAISEWLVHPGYEVRAVACTLAADLRLAELVPALRQAHHFAPNEVFAETAREALVRLDALAPEEKPVEAEVAAAAGVSTPGD